MGGGEFAQVIVSTVATICMIGLGFLYRPGRATGWWSLAFAVVMVCAYVDLIAGTMRSETLRLIGMGVLLGAPVLIWSGLRALRGATSYAWIALVMGAGSALALVAAEGSPVSGLTFRLVFAVMAVFAALAIVELVRRPEGAGGIAAPLTVFSLLVVAVAATALVATVVSPGSGQELDFLREVNSLGILAYIICALVTLLFLARGSGVSRGGRTASGPEAVFRAVASDRLRRAQSSGERSWAMLYVLLDDAEDLRTISGEQGFATLVGRLRDDLAEIFPTEADIGRLGPAAFGVLVAQPSTVIRDRVRTLLRTVNAPYEGMEVGTSASIGWAGVAEHGYDVDVLLNTARAAAARAVVDGGDRWQRALG